MSLLEFYAEVSDARPGNIVICTFIFLSVFNVFVKSDSKIPLSSVFLGDTTNSSRLGTLTSSLMCTFTLLQLRCKERHILHLQQCLGVNTISFLILKAKEAFGRGRKREEVSVKQSSPLDLEVLGFPLQSDLIIAWCIEMNSY